MKYVHKNQEEVTRVGLLVERDRRATRTLFRFFRPDSNVYQVSPVVQTVVSFKSP